jgi:hypothetical protein
MGGVVNVAIRFKSGEAICQERWTNNTPFWFKHPKMFSGDEEYVRKYIAMTANNDHEADPFAPGVPSNVENSEYGLIVFDYMTNTILDNNHYATYNHLDIINFVRFDKDNDEDNEPDYRRALTDAGLVHVRKVFYREGEKRRYGNRIEIDPNPISLEDAITLSKELWRIDTIQADARYNARLEAVKNKTPVVEPEPDEERCWTDFVIDTSPMTYIQFDNSSTAKSTKQYREKLVEIGFPMNSKQGLNKTLKTKMSMTAIRKARKAWHDEWQKKHNPPTVVVLAPSSEEEQPA